MISLRLARRPDGTDPVPESRPIAQAGTTIGRAPECDLVLDDPLRLVSRRHAWLAPHGIDAAVLRCISTGAALQVNGETLPPGGERLVHDGDCLRIGGFEVFVDARPSGPTAAPRRQSRLDRWFDLDTAADPLGPGSPLPPLGATTAAQPLHANAVANHLAVAEAQVWSASMSRAQRQVEAPQEATQAIATQQAEPRAAAPAAPPMRGPAEAVPAKDWEMLQQAFMRGAGLDEATPFTLDSAAMEHLGALLRTMTESTLALLRSRAVAKRGIRAEGTQIAARQNNPLKFAPDAAQAMTLLLSAQSQRGFLDPLDALHDAHNDLQVHQLAMVAGMRAAVLDLLTRLGPQAVEAAQGSPQGWVQRIPALRDASLWRRHREQHERLMANLDEVFEATFGREFLLAYEAQSKLGAAAAPAGDRDALR